MVFQTVMYSLKGRNVNKIIFAKATISTKMRQFQESMMKLISRRMRVMMPWVLTYNSLRKQEIPCVEKMEKLTSRTLMENMSQFDPRMLKKKLKEHTQLPTG